MENNEIILYKSVDGAIKVDVLFENETVWLSIDQLCDLFGKSRSTINEHILNIYSEQELFDIGKSRSTINEHILNIYSEQELFDRGKSTISEHIKNIFEEGELDENSVVRKFRTTAADGKDYDVTYYNLDVIISVGYRVKSQQGTQFRIWATQRLREYIIKGFALNDERFKSGSSMNYFRELLDRIREILLSEKVFYQQINNIFLTPQKVEE